MSGSSNMTVDEIVKRGKTARSEGSEEEAEAKRRRHLNIKHSAHNPVKEEEASSTMDLHQVLVLPVQNPAIEEEASAMDLDEQKSSQEKAAKEEAEADKRRHLNVVFLGHSEAGKSTILGQILFLTGQVDDQEIQQYKEEAKEKGREGCHLAYIMDTDEVERRRSTVEVGRAMIKTKSRTFTILDVPGHRTYVPEMVRGASQADIGVLVISARRGEFETGFQEGGEMEMVGQTREHVQIARGLGVLRLLVVVNKMDDPTVMWSKDRYDEIKQKVEQFLQSLESFGYRTEDVVFLPICGLTGSNMDKSMGQDVCTWWSGPTFFEALDSVKFVPPGDPNGPFRMPIFGHYKDEETVVMGNVESGRIREVLALYCDEVKVEQAGPRDNLTVHLRGVEDEDILSGFVLSSVVRRVPAANELFAQLRFLKQPQNVFFYAGYKAVLHIHAVAEECEITRMMPARDNEYAFCRIQVAHGPICMESSLDIPRLRKFVLRCGAQTIAIGYVV